VWERVYKEWKGKGVQLYGFTYQPWWAAIAKDGTLLRTGLGPSGEDELVSTIKRLTGR
jgi:hypothetical protein